MRRARTEPEPSNPPAIHPTAVVDPSAELAPGVSVGPYAILGPGVVVGAGTQIGPHAYLVRDTVLGTECVIGKSALLGGDPQDLKYEGEETRLVIGDRTTVREFATLHRGTRAAGVTQIGDDCLIMAYAHVSHDSVIGNHVILSNAVQMGGHVSIEDYAIIGGLCALHQFIRIGTHAMVGGASRVPKDIPPYTRAAGSPCRLYGLNSVGLQRRGFSDEARRELKRAYRTLFASKLNLSDAVEALRRGPLTPEAERLVAFVETSERGVTV
jgi:UDP-N-acetylglucosamine acyltransferase